jgi:hypothetical protein
MSITFKRGGGPFSLILLNILQIRLREKVLMAITKTHFVLTPEKCNAINEKYFIHKHLAFRNWEFRNLKRVTLI